MAVYYCTADQVKSVSKVSYDQLELSDEGTFTSLIETLIRRAERIIDDYCQVHSTLFKAGGLDIADELHDSEGDGEVLTLYRPILSVSKLEMNTVGLAQEASWTLLSEGPGAGTHYLVYRDEGLIYVYGKVPAAGRQRIRVSYTAGYSETPKSVEQVCVEMVARMLEAFTNRVKEKLGELGEFELRLTEADFFSRDLKQLLTPYVHVHILRG